MGHQPVGGSLSQDDFLRFVRTQFETFGVPYAAICFEITETAAIASFARATEFIHELKMLGCGFSLMISAAACRRSAT